MINGIINKNDKLFFQLTKTLNDLTGLARMIKNNRPQDIDPKFHIPFYRLFRSQRQKPVKEIIEAITLPPTVHIGLAKSKTSIAENPSEEILIINSYVPGTGPINSDSRRI